MTLCIVGFDDLVTSFVATIATGWSDPCRVGLSPTWKPRLYAAHIIVQVEPSSTDDPRRKGALPLAAVIAEINPYPLCKRGHLTTLRSALGIVMFPSSLSNGGRSQPVEWAA